MPQSQFNQFWLSNRLLGYEEEEYGRYEEDSEEWENELEVEEETCSPVVCDS